VPSVLRGIHGSATVPVARAEGTGVMLTLSMYSARSCAAGIPLRASLFVVQETTPATPPKPRLLDRVRAALRARTAVGAPRKRTSRGSNATIFFFHASLAASSAKCAKIRCRARQRILAPQRPVRGSKPADRKDQRSAWEVGDRRDTPPGLAASAVIRRPAYPGAEFELAGHVRAAWTTKHSSPE